MQPRILIAEDDALQGAILLSALERRGYAADIVTDGLQAVRRLRTGSYDLALLDYHLPEIDGLAAARILHDVLPQSDCPYLIAVTATSEGLEAKERIVGGTAFDAIVSKRDGLPALLGIVDANMAASVGRHAAAAAMRLRVVGQYAAEQRRRHWLAPFAALPGLGVAAAFAAGIVWGAASLQSAGTALDSAHRTVALAGNAADLLGAVQDTDTSALGYVSDRTDAAQALFTANLQRVDQMLSSPVPLTVDGEPDPARPQMIVIPHLRQLNEATRAGGIPSAIQAHQTGSALRSWASALVSGSQAAVFSGVQAVQDTIRAVLVVLGLGVMYGLWNASRSTYRFWRGPVPRQMAPASRQSPEIRWVPLLD